MGIVTGEMKKQAPDGDMSAETTRVVIAAKKILAQPQVSKHILGVMETAADPATGIAQATIFLMKQLYAKSKGTMPLDSLMPAAQEVIVDVMRLGAGAGLFEITPELSTQAAKLAYQMFKRSYEKATSEKTIPAAEEQPAVPAAPAAVAAPVAQPPMGA